MKNLFETGNKRPIEERDIFSTMDDHKSSNIMDQFLHEWDIERTKKNPQLFLCIFRLNFINVFLLGVVRAFLEIMTA